MLVVVSPAMTLALSTEVAVCLYRLAELRGVSLEAAAIGAIQFYLEQIEGLAAFERSAVEVLYGPFHRLDRAVK